MLNTTLILALLCSPMVACLAGEPEPDPGTSSEQQGLICSPLCDGGYQPELQEAYRAGFGLFSGAQSIGASCADIGASAPQWDCAVTFVSSANPCGTYTVECLGQGPGQKPRCNWSNPYNCP